MRKNFDLSEEIIQYLDNIKKEYRLRSISAALERVCSEHKSNNDSQQEKLAQILFDKIEEKYGKDILHIRLGTRESDINSQISLEVLNLILTKLGIMNYIPIEKTENPALSSARTEIKKKIAKKKQCKDFRKRK